MNSISFNRRVYNSLKKDVLKNENQSFNDEFLYKIQKTLTFAWNNFPGMLSDFEFEEYLQKLSLNKQIYKVLPAEYNASNVVLHYATKVYSYGGHTRVLSDWINNDDNNTSKLFVYELDGYIPQSIRELNCELISNEASELIEAVRSFLKVVYELKPKCVVLHNHPNDVLPILANAYLCNVPVVFFNHADFVFSSGVSRADIGVSFCRNSLLINEKYRFNRNTVNKYLPLYIREFNHDSKTGIKSGVVISIMSSAYKTQPYKEWSIYKVIEVLQSSKKVDKIELIGFVEEDIKDFTTIEFNDKVKFHGILENPSKILRSSDIFIESIPIGTGLSTLEAIAQGCYPIFNPTSFLIYEIGAAINHFDPDVIKEYKGISSFQDYIDFIELKIDRLIKNEIDNTFYKNYLKTHNQIQWKEHLIDLYDNLSKVEFSEQKNVELITKNSMSFASISSKFLINRVFSNTSKLIGWKIALMHLMFELSHIHSISNFKRALFLFRKNIRVLYGYGNHAY
jgi:hypothetical protein